MRFGSVLATICQFFYKSAAIIKTFIKFKGTNVSNFLQFISQIIGVGATDRLIPEACLTRGQYLTSQDGLSVLILSTDGDLCKQR